MVPIECKEEAKNIIDSFEKLMPWEKGELVKYLADKCMTWPEIEEYFIKGTGYVDPDEIDAVDEVMKNSLEYDVLERMNVEQIRDFLLDTFDVDDTIREMLEYIEEDTSIEIIKWLDSTLLAKALIDMKKTNETKFKELLLNILDID